MHGHRNELRFRMDIRQIRYLASAVEGGSLSAAAKAQFVTVQAVSKAISELEHELGVRLLTRGNHGVAPTAVGEALYQRARAVLKGFDELVEFSNGFPADKSSSHLTIALCSPQFNNGTLALSNLGRMTERVTGYKTSIISASGEQCLEALNSHAVDAMATVGTYSSPDTDVVPIGALPVGIVLGAHHPLAAKSSLNFADLAPYPVLASDKYDTFNRSILRTCQERGLSSQVVPYREGFDTFEFFQKKHGFVFAVHMPNITHPDLNTVNLPVDAASCGSVPLCLVTPKSYKTPAYLALEKSVGEIFRSGRIL